MRDNRKIPSLHQDHMDAIMVRQTAQWLKEMLCDRKGKLNVRQRNQKPFERAIWEFVVNEPMKFLQVLRNKGAEQMRWYDAVRNAKGEIVKIKVEIT